MHSSRTILPIVVSVILVLASSGVGQTLAVSDPPRCDWSTVDYTDFYDPPPLGELTPDRLGEVLRAEHINSLTPQAVAEAAGLAASLYGAEVYRILYLSQTAAGAPQAISGRLLVPTVGLKPDQGFPVLAFAHGATGMADICAPSKYPLEEFFDLFSWVAQGFVVTATDYSGLGTPGLHPFMVGAEEGISVVDSVRAAQKFCDDAHDIQTSTSNRVILNGRSQGGHAVLFAHQMWPSYAPELDLLGTIALAPAAELRLLAQSMVLNPTAITSGGIAMVMYSFQEYYGLQEPTSSWMQEPYATILPPAFESRQCTITLLPVLSLIAPETLYQPHLLAALKAGDWAALQPWTEFADVNTPGNFAGNVPLLILQGDLDTVVMPETTVQLARHMCVQGNPIQLSLYTNTGHGDIPAASRAEVLTWAVDRVAGLPAPENCSQFLFQRFFPTISVAR